MLAWSRRGLLIGAAALAACGRKDEAAKAPAAPAPATPRKIETIADAVAGEWREPADRARDAWRHPAESLAFWGLAPGMTVLEFWPGAGWYTDIIAPFLAATGGVLYAANLETGDPAELAARQTVEAYQAKLAAFPRRYGQVRVTAFGATSGPPAPSGSADLALFLRNLHNWMTAGIAEKAFHDAFTALKPGGLLGIEEHRGEPGGVQDVLAADGYVQEDYVRQLAAEAGFVDPRASEINANPADTKDHPFGVWTLPPTRASSPRGQPPNPTFDHAKYAAIGESDRMTLRFMKPR